jgi:hypothetical protein
MFLHAQVNSAKHTFYIQYILPMSLTVSDIIYPTIWETLLCDSSNVGKTQTSVFARTLEKPKTQFLF